MKEEAVLSYWNKTPGLHLHRKPLSGPARRIVRSVLSDYTLDEIKEAIWNYSTILLDKTRKLKYKWTLSEFLTRKRGPCKDDPKQLWRFLADEFDPDKFERVAGYVEAKPVACHFCSRRSKDTAKVSIMGEKPRYGEATKCRVNVCPDCARKRSRVLKLYA